METVQTSRQRQQVVREKYIYLVALELWRAYSSDQRGVNSLKGAQICEINSQSPKCRRRDATIYYRHVLWCEMLIKRQTKTKTETKKKYFTRNQMECTNETDCWILWMCLGESFCVQSSPMHPNCMYIYNCKCWEPKINGILEKDIFLIESERRAGRSR